jgi:acyl carrier protein
MMLSGSAAVKEPVASAIRNIIAAQLRVSPRRVSDEARLVEDLGADWLDRIELMIAIEDHFDGLQIAEAQADQITMVGDLIRFVEAHPSSAEGLPRRTDGEGAESSHSTVSQCAHRVIATSYSD